eukprot:gene4476-biopygen3643
MRNSRKAPKDRTPFLDPQPCFSGEPDACSLTDVAEEDSLLPDVQELGNFTTCSTQTDFSFVKSPVYLVEEVDVSYQLSDHPYTPLVSSNEQQEYVNLQQKIEELSSKVSELNSELAIAKKALFSIDKLKGNDQAVKFYTGFPNFTSLQQVFNYLAPKLKDMSYWRGSKSQEPSTEKPARPNVYEKSGPKRKLSHFEEFIMVLMRLKVGLFVNDLADRFGISSGYVSKVFTTWINFLFHELPLLFPFPSQENVRRLMPEEFKMYPTTRIIIDCTEIFIEVPSSMKAQSQTWSEYKHRNTWKALVGITPTGAITFVSKHWSGRVSDKEITSKSGILSFLEPGDNVMADRGFDIADILPDGVTLNIPPFKGNRPQLTPKESEETARIAAVRIHVERAIGREKQKKTKKEHSMQITLRYKILAQDSYVCVIDYLTMNKVITVGLLLQTRENSVGPENKTRCILTCLLSSYIFLTGQPLLQTMSTQKPMQKSTHELKYLV